MPQDDDRDDFSSPDAVPEDWAEDLKTAAAFLTRIPLNQRESGVFALARAFRTFPIVGALAGFGAGLVLWLAVAVHLPANLACLVAIFALIAVTGALHEDGLADTADGFWGGSTRERKLEIMRDSRVGTFGLISVVASVLLRSTALESITLGGVAAVMGALIAAESLSRHNIVAFMAATEPARSEGLAFAAGRPSPETARTSLVLALVVGVPALWVAGGLLAVVIGLVITSLAYGGMKTLAIRQISGHTGDTCGAVQQVTEAAILLGLAAIHG